MAASQSKDRNGYHGIAKKAANALETSTKPTSLSGKYSDDPCRHRPTQIPENESSLPQPIKRKESMAQPQRQ